LHWYLYLELMKIIRETIAFLGTQFTNHYVSPRKRDDTGMHWYHNIVLNKTVFDFCIMYFNDNCCFCPKHPGVISDKGSWGKFSPILDVVSWTWRLLSATSGLNICVKKNFPEVPGKKLRSSSLWQSLYCLKYKKRKSLNEILVYFQQISQIFIELYTYNNLTLKIS
jgi:hypothetical protein